MPFSNGLQIPQPPRPFHYSATAFFPDPLSFEDDSPDHLIRLGQSCNVCSAVTKWIVHKLECMIARAADCQRCTEIKEGIQHHTTVAELEESCRSGCHMCARIWNSLLCSDNYDIDRLRASGKVFLMPVQLQRSRSQALFRTTVQWQRRQIGDSLFILRWDSGDAGSPQSFPLPQSPDIRSTRTASRAGWGLIHGWIQQCVSNHPECSRSADCILPNRLLQVTHQADREPRYTVRLVNSKATTKSSSKN
jgi:hypothetical protein